MIESLLQVFAIVLQAVFEANGEAGAEEEALMNAEARIARLRAERKFR